MIQELSGLLPEKYIPIEMEELEGSVIDRFDKIVALFPNRIAVKDAFDKKGVVEITYQSLDSHSNSLAARMSEAARRHAEPGSATILLFNEGYLSTIAQLAVLKAGRHYTFLDVSLTPERLQSLAASLQTSTVLCDEECFDLAKLLRGDSEDVAIINLSDFAFPEQFAAAPVIASATSIACVTYTSGSTGEPEGVLISHRSLMNFVRSSTNSVRINESDVGTQLCPLYSIASASDVWSILLNGACLMPYSIKRQGVIPLANWLTANGVTLFNSVPTIFRLMLQFAPKEHVFADMRVIRMGGDRLLKSDVELFKRHFGAKCFLRLVYGSVESLSATHNFVFHGTNIESEIVPIGYEMENVAVSLVDAEMNEVPQGEVGEMAITSKYMANGYFNNPELTSLRFKSDERTGAFRYLTNDLAYRDEEGCLHHVGRKDFQIKLYGKLVSLSQIEASLLAMPFVKDAAVISASSGVEQVIVAFYSCTPQHSGDEDEIRKFLMDKLPVEKIPKKFVCLEKLPLTKSNKLDRKQLQRLWTLESGAAAEVR